MTLRLDPAVASARGLSPGERARAVARAKSVAFTFAAAVRGRNAHMVQRSCDGLSREELAALAIVLAEAADPARLKVVTEAPDDGMPAQVRAA